MWAVGLGSWWRVGSLSETRKPGRGAADWPVPPALSLKKEP